MEFEVFARTDTGPVRENNEDSFLVDDNKGVYCVADGVGGLPFGNLASRLAVKLFAAMIHDSSDCVSKEELKQISHRVHHDVVECGHLVGGENGIGTTFSAIRILPNSCLFASATKAFPGPTNISTGFMLSVPIAIAATA